MRKPGLFVLSGLTLILIVAGVILAATGGLSDGSPGEGAEGTGPAEGSVPRISVTELSGLSGSANPPLIWEFVGQEQFSKGHIPGSQLMTFDGLQAAARNLDRARAIVTVCT